MTPMFESRQMSDFTVPFRVDLPSYRDHCHASFAIAPALAGATPPEPKTPMPSDSPGPLIRPPKPSRRS